MFNLRYALAVLVFVFLVAGCTVPASDSKADKVAETGAPATASVADDAAEAAAIIGPNEMSENLHTEALDSSAAHAADDSDSPMADGDMGAEEMAGDTLAEDGGAIGQVPDWQTIVLTNATTGETFTLADFAGKTVFVEPFATWCGNCRRQLGNVDALRMQLDADVVFLALSVEPNIGNEALSSYAEQTGYGLIFAAMPLEMVQLLAAEYGQTITNPSATPHFVVAPDGTSSELFTGIQSVDDLWVLLGATGS